MCKCKNCIHHDVCAILYANTIGRLTDEDVLNCEHFMAAIDVAQIVHGEWVLEAQEGNANYAWIVTAKCSACGDYIGVIWRGLFPNIPDVIAERTALDCAGQITLRAYCSECGAKMDKKSWER